MAARTFTQQARPQHDLTVILLAGVGFAALFRAAQITAEIITLLEGTGAMGGTRDLDRL